MAATSCTSALQIMRWGSDIQKHHRKCNRARISFARKSVVQLCAGTAIGFRGQSAIAYNAQTGNVSIQSRVFPDKAGIRLESDVAEATAKPQFKQQIGKLKTVENQNKPMDLNMSTKTSKTEKKGKPIIRIAEGTPESEGTQEGKHYDCVRVKDSSTGKLVLHCTEM